MSKALSQSPAAVAARARRAAQKATTATQAFIDAVTAQPTTEAVVEPTTEAVVEPTTEPESTAPAAAPSSVFGAIASTLSAEETEAAEEAAIAALKKAKAPKSAPSAPKLPDSTRLTVGAYNGRAGAMFELMKVAGRLNAREGQPEGFTRAELLEACVGKHPILKDRASNLTWSSWAVRHGLLIPCAAAPVAVVVESPAAPQKAQRAPKGSKKGSKARAQA